MVENAINLMVQMIGEVMPVALVFGFTNLLINTVLSAAFGGKLVKPKTRATGITSPII